VDLECTNTDCSLTFQREEALESNYSYRMTRLEAKYIPKSEADRSARPMRVAIILRDLPRRGV